VSIAAHYGRVRSGLSAVEREPLRYWKFAAERLKSLCALFTSKYPIEEGHGRACNKGTKTETGAAMGLACGQKREHLDGVPLPRWRGPVEVVQLVLDYKQQLLSVQPAYQRLLGAWPHHIEKQGPYFSRIHVMPVGGRHNDRSDWSTITFLSEKNITTGVGVRGDVILFDEPPPMSILRELRKASHAGRRSITMILETPTIRRQWQPISDDYGDTPRRSLRRVDQDRAEARWSLDEVADWVLSPAEKARLIRRYQGDPLLEARLHGDYCITEGSNPLDRTGETLQAMRALCRDPEMVEWRITQEADAVTGRTKVVRTVPVELFRPVRLNQSYWVTIDPSSGTDDAEHDPYELQVTEDGSGDLCLRAGGYLPGFLVGVLAVGIARQYNNAPIDPEVNDRWGVNVVEGVMANGYSNFAREKRELRPGQWSEEIGFHNTGKTRPLIIGALQTWVSNWRAGIRYADCPSRFVIDQLLDLVLDSSGKIVGAPGVHDDAVIVRGQALRRAVRRYGLDVPDFYPPKPSKDQEIIAQIMGKEPEPYNLKPGPISKPRERPRV